MRVLPLFCRWLSLFAMGASAMAQTVTDRAHDLPTLVIHSARVANQEPSTTFAMPVSGLQFEPIVDVQARNFAEAQSDVAIRGGTFENTGFKLGSVGLFDPQTGHYFAEIPVAPLMLGSPRVLTGADNAIGGFNAGVGTVSYNWLPIVQRGEAKLGFGENAFNRQSFYQSLVLPGQSSGHTFGADVEISRSESDGPVEFGDHKFERFGGRIQLQGSRSQTDLFAGQQRKFFGWPNLYTPFGFNETEYLKTELYLFNHKAWSEAGSFWQVGAFYRRNFDDYEFNRAIPGASNPFVHTTAVKSAAFDGRQEGESWAVSYAAQYLSDRIRSTSLTSGKFNARSYLKLAMVPEYGADIAAGQVRVRAGVTYDDTNRDESAVSPVVEISLLRSTGLRLHAQYAESSQVATYTALNSSATSGLFRGNPGLGRETSRNAELGAELTRGAWRVQMAVFERRDDNLVDWTYRNGITARTANPVDIRTNGVEFVAIARTTRLDVVFGYTFLDKVSDYGSAAIDASFYALNFARHRFTAAFVARLGRGFELRVDNEYRQQEDNLLRTIGGDEAFTSSIGVHYFPPAIRGVELSVRVDNLWDEDFQEVPAVPAGGRQASAGIAYRW